MFCSHLLVYVTENIDHFVIPTGKRSRVAKTIKKEIIKVRRKLALQKGHSLSDIEENCGMDTGER